MSKNETLYKALCEMDEVQYRQLVHCVNMSEVVREIMKVHKKDEEFMCNELKLDTKDFRAFRNAAYNWDLHLISRVQVLRERLETEAAAAKAKQDQILQFPDYEFSKPIHKEEKPESKST